MFYLLTQWFSLPHVLNPLRYISFRSFMAFLLAFILALWWGKLVILWLKRKQFGQVIREEGPQSHHKKKGTPTMGGLFLWMSAATSTFLFGNWTAAPVQGVLAVACSYALLGFIDDYRKITKRNTIGISARGKLLWQFATALIVMAWMTVSGGMTTELYIPFLKSPLMDLGYFYWFFGALVIVGTSNAVNLTDGLDGLAIVPIMVSLLTLGLLAYLGGHLEFAQYLYIPYVKYQGELLVLSCALMGAGMGFLWYNTYPAQIFMGDLGALSLGGVLGTMAVISKNELLFVLIGGIFVVEALSVILQVFSFKTRGKRIFRMAPIHHHFELKGWEEPKVIVRFWMVSILLSVLALATIKLR